MTNLYFTRLSANALPPQKATPNAAGFDLRSASDVTIPAHGKALVPTDLSIELPPFCYGRIAPRSGLAWEHFIDVGAGVIDNDYSGNVMVLLFNFNNEPYCVNQGDRIAQLIVEKYKVCEARERTFLPRNSQRGNFGFGSTGLK